MDPVALLKGALPPIAASLLFVSLWGARALPRATGKEHGPKTPLLPALAPIAPPTWVSPLAARVP